VCVCVCVCMCVCVPMSTHPVARKPPFPHPLSTTAHFHKALVLSALDADEEALLVLQRLQQLAPRESAVHFVMGKIYKKVRE
jgi:hypothetical protein